MHTPQSQHRPQIAVRLSVAAVRKATGVALPRAAVQAAFRLFGAATPIAQLSLLWQTVGTRDPSMQRLRSRAVRSIADYRAIINLRPDLARTMKLDFTILLGLYREAIGISCAQAVSHGLVETYCLLSALVDAYDDLIDAPDARSSPLAEDDFRTGRLSSLRAALVEHLQHLSASQPGAARLPDDLARFEAQAWQAHQSLDLGSGLDAALEDVARARAATSGLLLRFAAHLWSVLLDLPGDLAQSSEDAAATFGLIAQFADDVIDWTADDGRAQNLLGAALREFPDELSRARELAQARAGWSLPVATLAKAAPQTMRRLAKARREASTYPSDAKFDSLRQFGDDVYDGLLPRLPAINYCALDAVRQDVQDVLLDTR